MSMRIFLQINVHCIKAGHSFYVLPTPTQWIKKNAQALHTTKPGICNVVWCGALCIALYCAMCWGAIYNGLQHITAHVKQVFQRSVYVLGLFHMGCFTPFAHVRAEHSTPMHLSVGKCGPHSDLCPQFEIHAGAWSWTQTVCIWGLVSAPTWMSDWKQRLCPYSGCVPIDISGTACMGLHRTPLHGHTPYCTFAQHTSVNGLLLF